jgi:predicted GH43/DUF377 family glycosyl hydrolase
VPKISVSSKILKNLFYIFCISLIFLFFACGPIIKGGKYGYPPGRHVALTFNKEPNQAVIGSGIKNLPIVVYDPFVLKDNMGLHLFYSTIFCKKGSEYYYSWDPSNRSACNILDLKFSTGYAFSVDMGVTWQFRPTPLILPGKSDWENRQFETPNVVKVEDKLYLFYCADGRGGLKRRFQIGVATLTLGGKSIYEKLMLEMSMFDRNGRMTPLIPKRSIGFFDMNVQEPSVIYKNNNFEVYYIGLELKEDVPIENLDNQNLIIRVGMGKAVFNRNLELVNRTSTPILTDVNSIQLINTNDTYYLFFTTLTSGGEFHKDEKIAYLVSEDGEDTWSRPLLILSKGDSNSFDSWGVMAPTVVLDNNKFYLFYTAWEVKDINCLEEPITRLGLLTQDNNKCAYGTLGRAIGNEQ